jgi:CheY-like chemotaxis protein
MCAVSRSVVLIVEDEFILRFHAAMLIGEAGFDTVEACSADEAIQLLESRADIDIVFTDIDLPGGMNGLDLCAQIRDRWPPVELVVTSSHSGIDEGDLPEGGFFLPKPYDAARLVRTLQRLG